MCLAIPMKLTSIDPDRATGTVAMGHVSMEVGLDLVREASVGDYLLIHVGMAIQIVEASEAEEILKAYQEFAELPGLLVPDRGRTNG